MPARRFAPGDVICLPAIEHAPCQLCPNQQRPMNLHDLLDLTGKVAVVTGASAGIGAGIARRLAEAGAAVAVHYRGGRDEAEMVVARITTDGGKAIAVHAELTDPDAVRSLFAEVATKLGPVDI